MNTKIVKERLEQHLGNNVTIRYNLGRNKYESYDVTLKNLYNNIFIVEGKNKEVKSFTYSDVITKIIKIYFKD